MSVVKVAELMSCSVVTVQPHHSVAHVREKMTEKKLSNVPVVTPEGEPVGVVSAADLLSVDKEGAPVSGIMTENVYTIPQYEEASIAARMMRNHNIHHLMVTSEQKIVGVISSFDLLKLVEGHRFVMKNPATPRKKGRGKRARAESA
jgi:CBS domain-containing protein